MEIPAPPSDVCANSAGSDVEPVKVRILTYNCFMRPPMISESTGDFKDSRLEEIGQRVLPQYDIVLLQEMFSTLSSRQRRLIKAASGNGFVSHLAGPPSSLFCRFQPIDGGLLTLSRYQPDSECAAAKRLIKFSVGTSVDKLCAKGVSYMRLKVEATSTTKEIYNKHGNEDALPVSSLDPGYVFHVFNTHLQASYSVPPSEADYQVRRTQLAELANFIVACVTTSTSADSLNLKSPATDSASAPAPAKREIGSRDVILVAGDFNVIATSSERKELLRTLECGGLFDPSDLLEESINGVMSPGTHSDWCKLIATASSSSSSSSGGGGGGGTKLGTIENSSANSPKSDINIPKNDADEAAEKSPESKITSSTLAVAQSDHEEQRLDYIFLLLSKNKACGGSKCKVSEIRVESFPISEKKYPQLSDHSGISLVLTINEEKKIH